MVDLSKIIIKKDDIVINAFCFYIIIQLLSITSVFFGQASLELILKIARYICYFVFLFKILLGIRSVSKKEIILLFICLLVTYFSKNRSVLITLFILTALKGADLEKLFKKVYNILLVSFFMIVFASVLKIIPDWTYMRGNVLRHSFGFLYPTDCVSIFLMIILLFAYNKKLNVTWYHITCIELVNILLFIYTNGRLSFILINLMLIILIVLKIKGIKKYFLTKQGLKNLRIIAYVAPLFLLILTNVLIFLPTNSFVFSKVDEILSHRIIYAKQAYNNYGIHVFGEEIEWRGWGGYGYITTDDNYEYNYVDNSYARILLEYGVMLTLIIIYAYTRLLLYCCDKKDIDLYIIIIIILVWSFVEPHLINVSRNVFVIALSLLLNEKNKNSRRLHEKIN